MNRPLRLANCSCNVLVPHFMAPITKKSGNRGEVESAVMMPGNRYHDVGIGHPLATSKGRIGPPFWGSAPLNSSTEAAEIDESVTRGRLVTKRIDPRCDESTLGRVKFQ